MPSSSCGLSAAAARSAPTHRSGHRGRDVRIHRSSASSTRSAFAIERCSAALEDVRTAVGGVLGIGEPGRRPSATAAAVRTRSATVARAEEVLPDERRQRLAELLLALDDDRGVRDRQAERVPEQRGDREPVGQRSDHRRLERRAGVSGPVPRRLRNEQQQPRGGDGGEGAGGPAPHHGQPSAAVTFLFEGRRHGRDGCRVERGVS